MNIYYETAVYLFLTRFTKSINVRYAFLAIKLLYYSKCNKYAKYNIVLITFFNNSVLMFILCI